MAQIRKWGSSLGVVLPKELVEQQGLKENDNVKVIVIKEANLKPIFGMLRTKMSGQEMKDLARSGWEK